MTNRRYKTPRIDFKKRLWLFVWINFDVLILNALEFKGDPCSLDEGARADGVSLGDDYNMT